MSKPDVSTRTPAPLPAEAPAPMPEWLRKAPRRCGDCGAVLLGIANPKLVL